MKITAGQCRVASMVAAAVFALPLSLGALTGLYLWTSPYLLLNRVLAGHGLVVMNALALAVLVPVWMRKRWYCKWLCPAGVLCDAVSNKRKSRVKLTRIPEFGKILVFASIVLAAFGIPLLSLLDPVNLFNCFFDAFRWQSAAAGGLKLSGLLLVVALNLLIPHLWCGKLCPLGGLQDLLSSLKRWIANRFKVDRPYAAGRRMALGALAGFGAGLVVRKASGGEPDQTIYPPGALAADDFKTACMRCGSCGRACPTGIIRYSFDPADMIGLLTPRVSFETGYCLPECTACGQVCSSGAIGRFTAGDKKKLVMGKARIHVEDCLLSKHKECDLCVRYCDYDAVKIRSSGRNISAWPEIIEDLCVGCGACKVVCPAAVISIVRDKKKGKANRELSCQ